MVGWHHRLDGHEFEQAPEVGDGQGGLAYCCPKSFPCLWALQLGKGTLLDHFWVHGGVLDVETPVILEVSFLPALHCSGE